MPRIGQSGHGLAFCKILKGSRLATIGRPSKKKQTRPLARTQPNCSVELADYKKQEKMKLFQLLLFLGLMTYACEVPAQTVYVTNTGEKYHKSSCHHLKKSKKEITLQKAIELRFTACSVCKPTAIKGTSKKSESIQALTPHPISNTPKATSTQCNGKTKAGTRCKRMTKSGNGRCYQHE